MIDIIIPTYNDTEGLERSLQSVLFNEFDNLIKVTVVNDASKDNYIEIQKKYPQVQWLEMTKNSGPGAARNYARKHTTEPYILFVDCGDMIYSKYSLIEVIDTIVQNPGYSIYAWRWVDEEYNYLKPNNDPSTPGKVYSRKFLEEHNLWQCEGLGSYAGEDMSLNRACQIILGDEGYLFLQTPIYTTITNNNSLTHKNNKEFMWKQTPGFIENIEHFIKLCEYNHVNNEIFSERLARFIELLYHQFLLGLDKNPEYTKTWWNKARELYINYYSKYENISHLLMAQSAGIKGLLYVNKTGKPVNIKKFLQELKNNTEVPSYYLNKV